MGSIQMIKNLVLTLLVALICGVTSIAHAAQPHSWCVTGEPLIENGSPDPTTNQIIGGVCSASNLSQCCDPSGRWGLECVQRASNIAITSGVGDVCGRYAWESIMASYDMSMPRDFNMVALAGDVHGIRHVEGPIATAGRLIGSYFQLNYERKERFALLSEGGAVLNDGQIFGGVAHQGTYSAPRVTQFDGGVSYQPLGLNFGPLQANLAGMSNALAAYDAIPAVKQYSSLLFVGNDPELNVFSVQAQDLLTTYDYQLNVPAGAKVIINVFGAAPEFKYAGFQFNASAKNILWNFPQATTLIMRSIGFRGSVLAPYAAADLRDGSLAGTLVVGTAYSNVELYTAPFTIPRPTGCQPFAPLWSCSHDTTINEWLEAVDVAPEAGFLEVRTEDYVAEGDARTSPTHRIWYSFQPAKHYPESKPLAVFFNGGPGSATSQYLFSLNTGPKTLDPLRTGSNDVAANNSANWTDFANLLYIDAPGTGFSYPVKSPDGSTPPLGTDMDRDAAIFLQVVTRFLVHHPTLDDNDVLIVGESYGGARAVLMMDHLLNYGRLIDTTAAYQDADLHYELSLYFGRAFGTLYPNRAQIVERWGQQALIQPVVAGDEQLEQGDLLFPYAPNDCMSPSCWTLDPSSNPATACDPYNCDQLHSWATSVDDIVEDKLKTVSVLEEMIGVDPRTIEWMGAAARVNAYGKGGGTAAPDMEAAFGNLNADDSYYIVSNAEFVLPYSGARAWYSDGAGALSAEQFVTASRWGVNTFLTVSRYDSVVPSLGVPYAIALFSQDPSDPLGGIISSVGYNPDSTLFGLDRPGTMTLKYVPSGNYQVPIAMPHYYEAGHTVPRRAPAELKADVERWYLGL